MDQVTTQADHDRTPELGRPRAQDAFEALYRDSRDDLFAYLTYLLGDRSLAEEITAQAFEKAFRKRATFRKERGDMRAWLFRIARNAAVDELRRSGRETALELIAVEPAAEPAAPLERLFVAQALRKLQPRDRELIALKFFAGLDNGEIARILRLSKSNVGTQMHRAVERLRAEMNEVDDA